MARAALAGIIICAALLVVFGAWGLIVWILVLTLLLLLLTGLRG